MKTVFVPCETQPIETRVALIPSDVKALGALGLKISVESGAGRRSGFADGDYEAAGASIVPQAAQGFAQADIVLRVRKPAAQDLAACKKGALHLSFLDPFNETALVEEMARLGLSAVSLEMIPRTTLAQKMDVQSSQSNLAGYATVLVGATQVPSIFPMMMTPAGTLSPARVFIIGVGVAGLQAIATAKRLGARIEAFDTRPVVEEQVKSLGAKFVKIDIGETGQTAQGYAKALTPEQLEKQRAGMVKVCAYSDVVITTAKVFGRKSPLLITREMMKGFRPGTLVLDMAVESGGNVEGSKPNEEVLTENGVRVLGLASPECRVPRAASQMFSANLSAFIQHFWDKEAGALKINLEDEIMKGCLITHNGAIVHERFKKA